MCCVCISLFFSDIIVLKTCSGMAKIGEREWYFFVHRDRRHGHGGRPNRTTKDGFWKATGSDRQIRSLTEPKKVLGLKKTLVYYKGRAPRGNKTDWVMNEYRLPDNYPSPKVLPFMHIYNFLIFAVIVAVKCYDGTKLDDETQVFLFKTKLIRFVDNLPLPFEKCRRI